MEDDSYFRITSQPTFSGSWDLS